MSMPYTLFQPYVHWSCLDSHGPTTLTSCSSLSPVPLLSDGTILDRWWYGILVESLSKNARSPYNWPMATLFLRGFAHFIWSNDICSHWVHQDVGFNTSQSWYRVGSRCTHDVKNLMPNVNHSLLDKTVGFPPFQHWVFSLGWQELGCYYCLYLDEETWW